MKYVGLFFFFLAGTAVAQPDTSTLMPLDTAGRVIALETTPCRGYCPVQHLVIYASGKVRYIGEENTQLKGLYELRLSKKELTRLRQQFRTAQFFRFKTSYQAKVSDLPSTYLTFSDGGRTHTVLDYYGTPQAIKDLEAQVLALVKRKGWRKVSGETR